MQPNIKYEDFDQAVKAAYKLGVLEGQSDIRNQIEDMRQQLGNMLKTNKHLFQLINQEHRKEHGIKLSPCFTRSLIKTLINLGQRSRGYELIKKYAEATGDMCTVKKNTVRFEAKKQNGTDADKT